VKMFLLMKKNKKNAWHLYFVNKARFRSRLTGYGSFKINFGFSSFKRAAPPQEPIFFLHIIRQNSSCRFFLFGTYIRHRSQSVHFPFISSSYFLATSRYRRPAGWIIVVRHGLSSKRRLVLLSRTQIRYSTVLLPRPDLGIDLDVPESEVLYSLYYLCLCLDNR
jgi:hypothetical protein